MLKKQTVQGLLLLLPAFIMLAAFTHIPALSTIWHSFFSTARGKRASIFIGLDNYRTLIGDEVFWKALSNNFWFALWTIPISIGIALLMAIWINRNMKGRSFLRLSYFAPTMLPLIAVANIWMFFYTPDFGLLAQIASIFGLSTPNWLGNPDTALGAIVVVAIWKESGFYMIFYLAALQSIPPSLNEAAELEGASKWYLFRRVTFPLLMPTTLFILINAMINAFRLVDHIFLMTEGGPNNASNLLLYYIYENAFKFWDTGYAATLTVVLLVILASVSIGQFILMDKKVHYR